MAKSMIALGAAIVLICGFILVARYPAQGQDPDRYLALRFDGKAVSLIDAFGTDKECRAFVRQRRDTAGKVYYGCQSGQRVAVLITNIFGKRAAGELW